MSSQICNRIEFLSRRTMAAGLAVVLIVPPAAWGQNRAVDKDAIHLSGLLDRQPAA